MNAPPNVAARSIAAAATLFPHASTDTPLEETPNP